MKRIILSLLLTLSLTLSLLPAVSAAGIPGEEKLPGEAGYGFTYAFVSPTTISNYLNYLMESFLFSNAKRYDVKGKKYFEYPSKYYCTDIGLRNARLNFRQQEETHIMENIIYNELLCRDYSVDVGVVEISETVEKKQSRKQCEIDFVVNRGAKKYYIQSALNVSDPSKMETELRPLKNTRDFFKKIIISKSSMKSWIDDDGILHLGLYEFLLNEAALDL